MEKAASLRRVPRVARRFRAFDRTRFNLAEAFIAPFLSACDAFLVIRAMVSMACLAALQRAKGKIEFIQAEHEEMAAFKVSAHPKFTGKLGVCIATSGPGLPI